MNEVETAEKSENRKPKPEAIPKSEPEIRRLPEIQNFLAFGFRISSLVRVSDFGLRNSAGVGRGDLELGRPQWEQYPAAIH